MRVSSLSDERVIRLVSRYFVPAWLSRDSYQLGPAGQEEKDEVLRLDRDRAKRGLKGGTVCVFLVAPDGTVAATLPVQQASKPEKLVPFLEEHVRSRRLQPRDPEAARATAAPRHKVRPKTEGGLLLHTWTRFEDKGPNRGVSQDWVEWTAQEWATLVPAADVRPGASWAVPRKVAHKLLRYLYPPGPHWDVKDCKLLKGTLTARVVSVSEGEARLGLEGSLELKFPDTGKPSDGKVTAALVGVARCDLKKRRLEALDLVSEEARYVWYWQGEPKPSKMLIAVELER